MEAKGFIFDFSKCVGCHACLVACYNENHTTPPISWRQISSQNPIKVPLSGFINLSLACNHCDDAPCLKSCPAKAYTKDNQTNAIIHNPNHCIGCTFCTWACPFDAPKYNSNKGVVEKCNFCNDRLKEGLTPACTSACPTGALSFGDILIDDKSDAPGMTSRATKPRINFKNQEVKNKIPTLDLAVSGYRKEGQYDDLILNQTKIDTIKEWPLVFFTLISSVLVGWFFGLAFNNNTEGLRYVYVLLGLIGMAISTLHLGKPMRAYRSIFNLRTSWLSREILFFILFLGSSVIALFVNDFKPLLFIASILGVLLLISIEFVYTVADKKYSTPLHSANTLLTALTFGFLITNLNTIAVGLLVVKAILYIVRYAKATVLFKNSLIGFVRFFVGIMVPLINLLFEKELNLVILISFIIGEIIDRFDYYACLHIDTPKNLLNKN